MKILSTKSREDMVVIDITFAVSERVESSFDAEKNCCYLF